MNTDELSSGTKSVVIDGATVSVNNKDELMNAIKTAAENKSLRNFKVFIAGDEVVRASDLDYNTVGSGANIEITPFDKAGNEDAEEETKEEATEEKTEETSEETPSTDEEKAPVEETKEDTPATE